MILCDIGNTTFHFLIKGAHKKYLLDENLPKLEDAIYFISVNENAVKKFLLAYPKAINLEPFVELKTSYAGAGIDRKLACFGEKSCVIVDAGSAITVDIMGKKKHKGGFILAGISNQVKTYKKISSKLDFPFAPKLNLDKIPQNTQEAISFAILKAIILPIKEVAKDKKIIFTGGDGEFLSSFFKNGIFVEDLIFKNMERIICASCCIAKR